MAGVDGGNTSGPSIATVTGTKRGRYVARACVECQTRKTKCTGTQPCEQCQLVPEGCVYLTPPSKRHREAKEALQTAATPLAVSLSSNTAAFQGDVVQRLGRLEALLNGLQAHATDVFPPYTPSQSSIAYLTERASFSSQHLPCAADSFQAAGEHDLRRPIARVNDLVSSDTPEQSAPDGGNSVNATASSSHHLTGTVDCCQSYLRIWMPANKTEDIANLRQMLQIYFKCVNSHYPCIDEAMFNTQLEIALSKRYWLKNFDYGGFVLFASGFVLFLFGISAGGSVKPWTSATVLVMIMLGAALLVVFVLWKCFAPLEQPLVPMHLFKNLSWSFCCVILGIAASVYYGSSVVWPTQVAVLYGDGNLLRTGWISICPGLANIFGQMTAGPLVRPLRHHKIQLIALTLVAGVALGAAATITTSNMGVETAMVLIGSFSNGWIEVLLLTNSTIVIMDQHEIGIAGGVCAGIRSAISAVATVVYVSVLSTRLAENLMTDVPAALASAGLPVTSVEAFITAIYAGTPNAFSGVPGVSKSIIGAGVAAYQRANVDAYRLVWLITIAFSGLALVLAFFTENTEKYDSDQVAATLRTKGMQQDVVSGKVEVHHGDVRSPD